ncbi:MAG: BON domain-containing protein [Labilithrix sp.]
MKHLLAMVPVMALGCTEATQLPIASGGPATNNAPEQTQTSSNSPLTASVSPEGRGHRQDRRVSDKVRLAIIDDPALKQVTLDRIRIETRQGKVIVAGIVQSAAQEKAILDRVKSVEGVTSVDDQVEVLPTF